MEANKKVVLLVIARFDLGGVPTQAFLWAKFLNENGFEAVILAPQLKDNRYCEMLAQHHIRYALLSLPSKKNSWSGNYRYFKHTDHLYYRGYSLVFFVCDWRRCKSPKAKSSYRARSHGRAQRDRIGNT